MQRRREIGQDTTWQGSLLASLPAKTYSAGSFARETRAISHPCTEPSCFGANGFSALIESCCEECCPELDQYCSEAECPQQGSSSLQQGTRRDAGGDRAIASWRHGNGVAGHAHHQSISLHGNLSSESLLEALRKVCPDMNQDCNVGCYEQIHMGSLGAGMQQRMEHYATSGKAGAGSQHQVYWPEQRTECDSTLCDSRTTPESYSTLSNDYHSPLTPPSLLAVDRMSQASSRWAMLKEREGTVPCQWADCRATFDDLDRLLKHLADDHLQGLHLVSSTADKALPAIESVLREASPPTAPTSGPAAMQASALSQDLVECLWSDCHKSTNISTAAELWRTMEHSTDSVPNTIVGNIWRHLLQDHIPTIESKPLPGSSSADEALALAPTTTTTTTTTTTPIATLAPLSAPDKQERHVCRWDGCGQRFASAGLLASHLDDEHVENGKSNYVCRWAGCERKGRLFSQRQKCIRHLIVHVNHRPFECPHCDKRFGEVMTLNQHLRTHSKEKPFECPVCRKGFATKGALTIHQRLHTGDKPFHCPFPGCDRSFSESSNLTKHQRMHSGVRPFACKVPGCQATFRRSDQLNRHALQHKEEGW